MIDRRKAELVGYAVAAFVLVLLALRLLHKDSGGAKIAVATPPATTTTSTSATPAGAPRSRMLVVDVAGEVRRPGVYRVPAGARVDSAVQQAGGITRHGEGTAVNLAMPLHDGQQVVVPRKGAIAAAGGASTAGSTPGVAPTPGAPMPPISLSTATVEQLDTLDGIGPTLAGRIIQYREEHGGFGSVDELRQVDGIGDKRFESLQKAVEP